jgi:hypothetical protein
VSPALFRDSQLAGNLCSGKNPKNIKNIVTRRVALLQLASQSLGPTNPNDLTGQNLNKPQNHIYY